MSSNSVVSVLRRKLKIKQIGFAGTLDPLAEGVLAVAVGKATKLIDYLGCDKEYRAQAQFGFVSTTYDSEGEITEVENARLITKDELINALKSFEGMIKQKPPIYSAVHVNGKRLYEFARKNLTENDVLIPEREVFVSEIKLLNFDEGNQIAEIKIACSKGTYIRSIVSDLGKKLFSGAVMTKLVRTFSGGFCVENSVEPDVIDIENVHRYLIPVESRIECEIVDLNEEEFEKVKHGNSFFCSAVSVKPVLVRYNGEVCALGFINNGVLEIKKVFV